MKTDFGRYPKWDSPEFRAADVEPKRYRIRTMSHQKEFWRIPLQTSHIKKAEDLLTAFVTQ